MGKARDNVLSPPLDRRDPAGSLVRVFHSAAPCRLFLIFLILSGIGTSGLRAELSDQQKKELFRKSQKGSGSSSGKSSSFKTAHASSSKVKSASNGSTKSPSKGSSSGSGSSKKKSGTSGTSGTSKKNSSGSNSLKKKSASSSSSGGSGSSTSQEPSHSPPPATHASQAVGGTSAAVTKLPLPHGATPSAPITIEKSGVEADQGLEPVPQSTPPPAPEGFWSRIFGSHRSYTYLSSSTRAAIDRAPVRKGRWKYIVIHNSGTREGNARVFDIYHRRVRHMQNGLAYHFVIGDGHGSGDGQVEVGPRWTRQINGGHVASDYLNDIALGICLVGDFNRDTLTKAQIGALEELVSYLRNRVGKSQGRQAIVHAHKEINPRPTDCPGDHFPYSWLHAKFGSAR